MSSDTFQFRSRSQCSPSLGARPHTDKADLDKKQFDLLDFLGIVQNLRIEFLPIFWDNSEAALDMGGTAVIQSVAFNVNMSFAFKTYHRIDETAAETFQVLIPEIMVLSQDFVRKHDNIGRLQGICWDTSHADQPWPVLVFEKSDIGHLEKFVHNAQIPITFLERLTLCVDIGKAIMDMHTNRIVHGDIKPENVLVFQHKPERYTAKVIDFGFSVWYTDENQHVDLAISHPWNAPENSNHGATWSLPEAKLTDIYSFGLLCLWFLLGDDSPTYSTADQYMKSVLQDHEANLSTYAQDCLGSNNNLPPNEKRALQEFFRSSLSQVPTDRKDSLRKLLEALDSKRAESKGAQLTTIDNKMPSNTEFRVNESIYGLYSTDYRVRSYIFRCLCDDRTSAPWMVREAAFCYYVGFGVSRNELKAEQLLKDIDQTIQVIEDEIKNISESSSYEAPEVHNLRSGGQVLWGDFTDLYLKQGRISEAKQRLEQELYDVTHVFGENHYLTEMLEFLLARVYTVDGRFKESKELEVRNLEKCIRKLPSNHTSILTGKIHLASTYKKLDQWAEAEKLEKEVISACEQDPAIGPRHPDMVTIKNNLAYTLMEKWQATGRRKEDEEALRQAQKVLIDLRQVSTELFGKTHFFTLRIRHNLVTVNGWLGEESKEVMEEKLSLVEAIRETRGKDHPDTLTGISNLASAYYNEDNLEEAKKWQTELVRLCEKNYGADHHETLRRKAELRDILSHLLLARIRRALSSRMNAVRTWLRGTLSSCINAVRTWLRGTDS